MIWGYPINDDGPDRNRRRKVDQAYERGPVRSNISLPYEYANRLAQNKYDVKMDRILPYHVEEGLGDYEDVYTPVESVCGGVDIDEEEYEKIKDVYKIFNSNDCGVLRLIGAKLQHFAFVYTGPYKHKYGIKNYLRFLINRCYPGSKVTFITDIAYDDLEPNKRGVDPRLYSKQRRTMVAGKDYCQEFYDGLPSTRDIPRKFDMLT